MVFVTLTLTLYKCYFKIKNILNLAYVQYYKDNFSLKLYLMIRHLY